MKKDADGSLRINMAKGTGQTVPQILGLAEAMKKAKAEAEIKKWNSSMEDSQTLLYKLQKLVLQMESNLNRLESSVSNLMLSFSAFDRNVDWYGLQKNLEQVWDSLKDYEVSEIQKIEVSLRKLGEAFERLSQEVKEGDFCASLAEIKEIIMDQSIPDGFDQTSSGIERFREVLADFEPIEGFVSGLKDFYDTFMTVQTFFKEGNLVFAMEAFVEGAATLGEALSFSFSGISLGLAALTGMVGITIAICKSAQKYREELQKPTPEMQKWIDGMDAAEKKSEEVTEAIQRDLESWDDKFSAVMSDGAGYGDKLAAKYFELAENKKRTAAETIEMKNAALELTKIYPELEAFYQKESGLLAGSREEIKATIEKQKELYRIKGFGELYQEAFQEQYKAKEQFDSSKKIREEAFAKKTQLEEDLQKYREHIHVEEGTGYPAARITYDKGYDYEGLIRLQTAYKNVTDQCTEAMENEAKAGLGLQQTDENVLNIEKELGKTFEIKQTEIQGAIKSYEKFGITLTNDLAVKLVQAAPESDAAVKKIFENLKNGVDLGGDQIKRAFSQIGIKLPDAFLASMEALEPSARGEILNLFASMKAGAQLSSGELMSLFDTLGGGLPQEMIDGLLLKGPEVLSGTMELFGRLRQGQELSRSELDELFFDLGVHVSSKLMESLEQKGPEVQNRVLDFLSNLQAGKEISEESLKQAFTDLGYELPDSLLEAVTSKDDALKQGGMDFLKTFMAGSEENREGMLQSARENGIGQAESAIAGFADTMDQDTSAQEAAEGLGGRSVDGMEDGTGVASPSREFRRIAHFCVQGFNLGIRDLTGSSAAEIRSWAAVVKAAVTPDTWKGMFDGLPQAFQQKWEELQTWWNTAALPELQGGMAAAFSLENWQLLFDNIRLAAVLKFEELRLWWTEEALPGFLENDVKPWFGSEKWMELLAGLPQALRQTLEEWKKHWNAQIPAWMDRSRLEQFSRAKWMYQLAGLLEAFRQTVKDWKNFWNLEISRWMKESRKIHFTKEVWLENLKGMKEGFRSAFKSVEGYADGCFDAIGDRCAEMTARVQELLALLDKLESRQKGSGGPGTGGGGEKESGSGRPGTALQGFAFLPGAERTLLSAPSLPQLASGAVIRGGNPFLAILGDQPAGQLNLEAPAGLIREMVREGLREEAGRNGGPQAVQVSLNVDGQEFARLTLRDFLGEMDRQGYDVTILGVT